MVWCPCPCLVFSTYALFSRSVAVWACLGLGVSINCCLLTDSIWDQSTLVVFNIHATPHTTHNTHPPTHFSRLTSFCSKNLCPLVLSRYCHYLVHHVIKSVLATHSADCTVLRTYLPVCLPSQVCAAPSTLPQQCYNGLQLNKPHNTKPQVYMEWHDNFPLQTAQKDLANPDPINPGIVQSGLS
jgi:hypothetical protein